MDTTETYFQTLLTRMLALHEWEIGHDNDGQLVIYTGLSADLTPHDPTHDDPIEED